MSEYEIATENVVSVKEETNALMPQEYIDMLYEYEEWKAKGFTHQPIENKEQFEAALKELEE